MTYEQIARNAARVINRPYSHKRYRRYLLWDDIGTTRLFGPSTPDPNMRKARNRVWRMKSGRIRVWSITAPQTRVRATGMDLIQATL